MTSASTFSEQAARPSPIPTPTVPEPNPEEVLHLPKRPSPLVESQCILHGQRPSAGQVVVVNSQQALAQIAEHSESNLRSELGGFLLGTVYREAETLFVDIHAAIPAHSNERGPVHFTFTADSWSQIHRDRTALYPQLDIVGWFHTHPGLGVFYSSDDVVVHSAGFSLPWHVGLVVDPVRREAAYFGWEYSTLRPGILTPIAGYFEMTDVQPKSVVDWRSVRTSVYNVSESDLIPGNYVGAESPMVAGNESLAHPDWLTISPSSRKLGLIIGSVALVLALFLLLFWILPLNRHANQMETVILALANTTANPNALACPDPRLRLLSPLNGSAALVGSNIELIGTAVYPGANRYQLSARPAGQTEWALIGSKRGGTELGSLGTWKTAKLLPAVYEVRLTAVDRNSIPLANSPDCMIQMQLIP